MTEQSQEYYKRILSERVAKRRKQGQPQLLEREAVSRRQFMVLLGALATVAATPAVIRMLADGLLKSSVESTEHKLSLKKASIKTDDELAEAWKKPNNFEQVFHHLSKQEETQAQDLVEKMKSEVQNDKYEAMLAVTKKFENQIRKHAAQAGFPQELALGMILVENGGGEDKISSEGARGIAQLMPDTARQYGLEVADDLKEGGADERSDPLKSLKAMSNFLKDHLDKFGGNFGLTLWSYHAGMGNVYDALSIYAREVEGVELGDLVDEKERVSKFSLHKVLSHPVVKRQVTGKLTDQSDLYAYKVVAAAELFIQEQTPSE